MMPVYYPDISNRAKMSSHKIDDFAIRHISFCLFSHSRLEMSLGNFFKFFFFEPANTLTFMYIP